MAYELSETTVRYLWQLADGPDRWSLVAVNYRRCLAWPGTSGGAVDEGLASGSYDFAGDGVRIVDLQDAGDLRDDPVHEPEVAVGALADDVLTSACYL